MRMRWFLFAATPAAATADPTAAEADTGAGEADGANLDDAAEEKEDIIFTQLELQVLQGPDGTSCFCPSCSCSCCSPEGTHPSPGSAAATATGVLLLQESLSGRS